VAPGDRSLLRRVTTLFRPYRVAVYGVGVLILLSSGLGVVSPLLIRVVFDRGLFARGGPDLSLALVLYGAMIAVPVLVSLLGVWQSYLTNRVGQDVMRDLRSELFSHLQRLSLRLSPARAPVTSRAACATLRFNVESGPARAGQTPCLTSDARASFRCRCRPRGARR